MQCEHIISQGDFKGEQCCFKTGHKNSHRAREANIKKTAKYRTSEKGKIARKESHRRANEKWTTNPHKCQTAKCDEPAWQHSTGTYNRFCHPHALEIMTRHRINNPLTEYLRSQAQHAGERATRYYALLTEGVSTQ